jgi:hypothetical protein
MSTEDKNFKWFALGLVLFVFFCGIIFHWEGRQKGYEECLGQIEKEKREKAVKKRYVWNDEGHIQYMWCEPEVLHVEPVAKNGKWQVGGNYRDATASELEQYLKEHSR